MWFVDSSFPSQRTFGGTTKLHGQEREIEQHRSQDPADESLRDRREDDDDDDNDDDDVSNGERKGGRHHHERVENDDGDDRHANVHSIDLDSRREDGEQVRHHLGHVCESANHRHVLGNATGDLTDGRKQPPASRYLDFR